MRINRETIARADPGTGRREDVAEILRRVRQEGDRAVIENTVRFDKAGLGPTDLRVEPRELEASVGVLEPALLAALKRAAANVRTVAEAQLRPPVAVDLPEGQRVEVAEVPGGRAPYLSTVVMCAVTARVAGAGQIAVCAPPGPGGRANPLILATCVMCEVNEVYRMGGAQAIAALAYGTESVQAVDLVVGPGNRWVTEAKRQVAGVVGIDGLAGPSELIVIAGADADPELLALDLLAQAEHGPDGLLALIALDRDL